MAKRCDSVVLDAALQVIRSGATRMTICSGEPTTYGGIAAVRLAETATSTADFSVGAGSGLGRRLTTVLQEDVPVSATGTGNHIALHNNSSILYYVTTCTNQPLTSGGAVNIPSWTIELAGPT